MTNGEQLTRVQGMTIVRPDGWHDKSMLILDADTPGPSGITPNLVVTRETAAESLPVEPVARLEEYVERQLAQMQRALAGFVVVSRRHATAAGTPAELQIDWTSDGTPLTQWVAYAVAGADALTVATATVAQGEFATMEPVFRSMLQSYRLS